MRNTWTTRVSAKPRARLFAVMAGTLLASGCAAGVEPDAMPATVRVREDAETGTYRWILAVPSGPLFQLVQRVPDQTRSFYIGRGFPHEAADRYASACVMQTLFNNNGDRTVSFDLADWRILHDGAERPLQPTAAWQRQWERLGVAPPARIAFQWSQFPNVQRHDPGDWFQGMIAAGLPPGSTFALKLVWSEDSRVRTALMDGLVCADDKTLEADR